MTTKHFLSESDFFAMRRQRNIALGFNVVQVFLLAFAIYAIISVAKWARPEPFLLKKDDTTGQVEIYQPYRYDTITIPEDQLYKESMAAHYVQKREEYFWYTFKQSQTFVNTYTEGNALDNYSKSVDPKTDGTLPNLLKNQGYARVSINSVQRLENDLYQVRWNMTISDNGRDDRGQPLKFVTVLKFRIGQTHSELSKRLVNPYGVFVYEYRTSQEN